MPEDLKPKEGESEPKPTPPQTFKEKINGKEVELTLDQLREKARANLAIEDLEARKAAWKQERQHLETAEQFFEIAKKRPELAEELDGILNEALNGIPRKRPPATPPRKTDDDGDPTPEPGAPDPAASTELAALRQQIADLTEFRNQLTNERQGTKLMDSLTAAATSHPLLAANEKARGFAVSLAERAVQEDPSLKPADAIAIAHEEVKGMLVAQAETERKQREERAQIPGRLPDGSPVLQKDEKFTEKDLHEGKVLDRLKAKLGELANGPP